MAKQKEELVWVAINLNSMGQEIVSEHEALRALFEQVKAQKAKLEALVDAKLIANAKAMIDSKVEAVRDAAVKLQIDAKGKFPAGSVRKYSYMRGCAVATAKAAKSKQVSGGLSFS